MANTIEKAMKEKGISFYSITGRINKNVRGSSYRVKKQISGEEAISYNDYITILKELNLTEEQVPYEPIKIRIK